MSIDFSVIRPKEKIEIAVSTETILYAPFYIAYYNNDFNDAPYCSLEVMIVGTKEDLRFDTSKKLKGDGFATFAVLLGLADAAICDPSYLIYLNSCKASGLSDELKKFQGLLLRRTKESICAKKELQDCLEVKNDGTLAFKSIELFQKQILRKNTKVIGGLVSKIAFDAIGSQDLLARESELTNMGLGRLSGDETTEFGKKYIDNFICYHNPSTGYCVGSIFYKKYNPNNSDKLHRKEMDFGLELDTLIRESHEKNDQGNPKDNLLYSPKSIAFSCDFIAIDFLLDKHNHGIDKKIITIDSLAFNEDKHMFTGILANTKSENDNKLQALLYGIDQNLYKIDSYLKNGETTGLIQYLKKKLRYTDGKLDLLLDLLIASPGVKARVRDMIKNDPRYSFDSVLRYYVERLNEWKQAGSLYYTDTIPNEADLENISKLRYNCTNPEQPIHFKEFIKDDYLKKFRREEARYWKLEHHYFLLRDKKLKQIGCLFLLPVLPILKWFRLPQQNLLQKLKWNIEATLWSLIRKPYLLYLFATLFLALEIISSMFHIFHVNFNLDKLFFVKEQQILLPGSKEHFTVERLFPVGHFTFWFFLSYLLSTLMFARQLLKLKQDSKYFYRNT